VSVTDASVSAGAHLRLDENGGFLGLDRDPMTGGTNFQDVAIDAADNLYFVGSAGLGSSKAYVRWAGASGTAWGHTEVHTTGNSGWRGVKTDSQGRIIAVGSYYTSTNDHAILRRYLPAGGYDLDKTDTSGNTQSVGVTVGATDNIYVAGRTELANSSGIIGSTATLTGWTPAGVRLFQAQITNKSSCTTTGAYTNGYAAAFDSSGGLWFQGLHCDFQPLLRQVDPTSGAFLLNADFTVPVFNVQYRMASDGVSLAVVGYGSWDTTAPAGFDLYDADLQGQPLRKFYYTINADDQLYGVTFIGRDRIVVGSSSATDNINHIWVARVRAP
jgi:hypothetical protein